MLSSIFLARHATPDRPWARLAAWSRQGALRGRSGRAALTLLSDLPTLTEILAEYGLVRRWCGRRTDGSVTRPQRSSPEDGHRPAA